jgi:PKD repeat protein
MSRTRVIALLALGVVLASALAGCLKPFGGLPHALFSASATKGQTPLVSSFNGTLSFDPDGQIVRYEWDFGDGTTASGAVASHEYQRDGLYTVRLKVTDDSGRSAEATLPIEAQNPQPTAEISYTPKTVLPSGECYNWVNQSIKFVASAEDDGAVVSYLWEFGPEGKVSPATAEGIEVEDVRFAAPGQYSVLLTVTDDDGATGQCSKLVLIGGGESCDDGSCGVGDICIEPGATCASAPADVPAPNPCPSENPCDSNCKPEDCPAEGDCEEGACR